MLSGRLQKTFLNNARLNSYLWILIASWLMFVKGANASTPSDEADVRACHEVAEHANAGTLDQISIPFVVPDEQQNDFLHVLQSKGEMEELSGALGFNGIAKADVFDDGKIETIVQGIYSGETHDLEYFDSSWHSIEVNPENNMPDDISKERLIRIGQQIYILNETGDFVAPNTRAYLHSLGRIGPDHIEKQACTFTQTIETETVISRNRQLCQDVLDEKPLDYSTFDHTHSLPDPLPKEDERLTPVSVSKAAAIDILNEGHKVYVVNLSGGYHDCTWSSLAILNDASNRVNKKRTTLLATDMCNTEYRPFEYQGKIYIEEKYLRDRPGYPEITQIIKGQKETICKFESVAVTIAP